MHLTPGVILAVLAVLLVAQLTRLVTARGPYAATLLLAAAGMITGELVAAGGHVTVGGVGSLHPLLDLPLMGALEVVGILMLGRSTARGG